MKKTRLAAILDCILFYAVVFVAAFLLFRLLLGSLPSLFAAVAATVAVAALRAVLRGKRKRFDADKAEAQFLQLYFDAGYAQDFFASLLACEPCGEWLKKEDTLYAPLFSPYPVLFDQAAPAFRYARQSGFKKLVYLTANGLEDGAQKLLASLEGPIVETLSGEKTFDLMTQPVEVTYKRKGAKQRFTAIRHALDRKNARRYLGAALVLFLGSYLMPYSIYYLAFACICTALGILCFFDVTGTKKPSSRQDSKRAR